MGIPPEITLEQLRQTPEFREFEGKEAAALDMGPRPEDRSATVTNHTPEESLARSFHKQTTERTGLKRRAGAHVHIHQRP